MSETISSGPHNTQNAQAASSSGSTPGEIVLNGGMDLLALRYTKVFNHILLESSLPAEARLLWAVLAHYGLRHGRVYPGQDTIAELMQISDRTVRRHLDHLKECGLVVPERRGRSLTNRYHLHPTFYREWWETRHPNEEIPEGITRDGSAAANESAQAVQSVSPDSATRATPTPTTQKAASVNDSLSLDLDLPQEATVTNRARKPSKREKVTAQLTTDQFLQQTSSRIIQYIERTHRILRIGNQRAQDTVVCKKLLRLGYTENQIIAAFDNRLQRARERNRDYFLCWLGSDIETTLRSMSGIVETIQSSEAQRTELERMIFSGNNQGDTDPFGDAK